MKQTSFSLGQGCIVVLSKHVKQTFVINISLVFQYFLKLYFICMKFAVLFFMRTKLVSIFFILQLFFGLLGFC